MTILKNYNSFGGRHWETGSVHNILEYQGAKAPHTGKTFSEEFLLGVSGGIAVGYFLFHYKGYEPQFVLLTRNTFDPLQNLLERLGISQTTLQTSSAEKGKANLVSVLEHGQPAMVWADSMSLPYNAFELEEDYWAMQPIVVFGHDEQNAHIADRSNQPLEVATDIFAEARARVKKFKHRVVVIDEPREEKLVSAATAGIWQCFRLHLEAPPRGTKKNFGLQALQNWAKMLLNSRNSKSWERYFPPGSAMFSALAGNVPFPGLYEWISAWGDGGAERYRYSQFLDEAAILLNKSSLGDVAEIFRESGTAWKEYGRIVTPDDISLLSDARKLIDKRHNLFLERGSKAEEDMHAINLQLKDMLSKSAQEFPNGDGGADHLRTAMSDCVIKIHDIEERAIQALQAAMS